MNASLIHGFECMLKNTNPCPTGKIPCKIHVQYREYNTIRWSIDYVVWVDRVIAIADIALLLVSVVFRVMIALSVPGVSR